MALFRKSKNTNEALKVAAAEDLDAHIARAHEATRALEALVTTAQERIADLPKITDSLAENHRRADDVADRLDTLAGRVDEVEKIRKKLEAAEARVLALESHLERAEEGTQRIESHRSSVDDLVALGQATLARLEGLKQDTSALRELEERLPRFRKECQPLFDQHTALKNDLDSLRTGIATLGQEAEAGREAALKARAHTTKVTEQLAEVERKLEPLSALHVLGKDTDAQLRTLNALAEHVAAKVKALENQDSIVEHALVESRRVHEMVWEMEVQLKKLDEGKKRTTRVEETLAVLERMHEETSRQLEETTAARDAFDRDALQRERDARSLLETVQRHVDQFAVQKQELETVHERLRVAQTGIAAAERRVNALAAREDELAELVERVHGVTATVADVTSAADSLQKKQAALGALEDRLNGLESMIKRTEWQFEGLNEQRKDLDTLKTEIQAVHATYEQTTTLLDKLRADTRSLEGFLDKAGSFMGQASAIDTKIERLAAQIAGADASVAKTQTVTTALDTLAGRLAALEPRTGIVENLEGRLNALTTLSADVDRRLIDQLGRRAELEGLNVMCEGLGAQMMDAQQKLASLNATRGELEPALGRLSTLHDDLERTRAAIQEVKRDDDALAAQEMKLTALCEASRALSLEGAQRLEAVRGLQAELDKASAFKEHLVGELVQIQKQQRDTFAQIEAADDQVKRVDGLFKKIDHRRSELEEAEQALGRIDGRMAELRRLSDDLERKIEAVGEREQVVEAVRRGIEGVHALGQKSQENLAAIDERRAEIAQATRELDRLRDSLAATQEKITIIEGRRQLVDDVQRKADTIRHILVDVQITLDSVSEQKAMVDHVFAELSRLEYVLQEARGTMRALQAERDVAQRIVENVRQIHARASGDERTAEEDRVTA
jgi:chromosome segregation ATPase